jgi:hypothetical protein
MLERFDVISPGADSESKRTARIIASSHLIKGDLEVAVRLPA